jgi:hypothetical protein
MAKSITVAYSLGDTDFQIPLSYVMQTLDKVQTITCTVQGASMPLWLQLRKFDVISLNDRSGCVPLFNEVNNSKNLDTILFIDKAHNEIMGEEKLKLKNTAA